jgi:glycosyltransferase involved in cell wall biosynthesis
MALRKDLASCKTIIYFHENQLVYPVRDKSTRNKVKIENKEQRDFQYGYNQILTSLVADLIVFNSNYNRNTFLENINIHLKMSPEIRYKINVKTDLEPKSSVVYFPINLNETFISSIVLDTLMNDLIFYLDYNEYLSTFNFYNLILKNNNNRKFILERPINILWNHRWEHDKNPDEFFDALFKLNELGINFRLHVIGEQYNEIPDIFNEAKEKLKNKIDTWGYQASKLDYYKVLSKCDLVISTALHEFFGVSV